MAVHRLVGFILIGLFGAHPAYAQQVVVPTEAQQALVNRLTPGAYETVWLVDGSRVTGTFARMSDNQIEITPKTRFPVPAQKIPFANIQKIRQGRADSLLNGALWGGIVGATVPLMVVNAVLGCDGCDWASASTPLGIAALFGGMGAGVGAGIDALSGKGGEVVYSRPTTRTVGVAPLVGRDRKGVHLSIGF